MAVPLGAATFVCGARWNCGCPDGLLRCRSMTKVGVLASGSGTNFQALHDACASGYADAQIAVVVTNKSDSFVRTRAEAAGVPSVFVDPSQSADRASYDAQIRSALEDHGVDLVCAAGFMRLLSEEFVNAFANRILNVHPSLLPSFPGIHAIKQAWEWGVQVTGATVHVVDAKLDNGPIVVQKTVAVEPGESVESLEHRIHLAEYTAYPLALKLWASGAVHIDGRRVTITKPFEDPPWAGGLPPGLEQGD